ncbi:MAG: hypothetical protein QXW10_03300 [Candidatus Micrarchaeaceae archaeon]
MERNEVGYCITKYYWADERKAQLSEANAALLGARFEQLLSPLRVVSSNGLYAISGSIAKTVDLALLSFGFFTKMPLQRDYKIRILYGFEDCVPGALGIVNGINTIDISPNALMDDSIEILKARHIEGSKAVRLFMLNVFKTAIHLATYAKLGELGFKGESPAGYLLGESLARAMPDLIAHEAQCGLADLYMLSDFPKQAKRMLRGTSPAGLDSIYSIEALETEYRSGRLDPAIDNRLMMEGAIECCYSYYMMKHALDRDFASLFSAALRLGSMIEENKSFAYTFLKEYRALSKELKTGIRLRR